MITITRFIDTELMTWNDTTGRAVPEKRAWKPAPQTQILRGHQKVYGNYLIIVIPHKIFKNITLIK